MSDEKSSAKKILRNPIVLGTLFLMYKTAYPHDDDTVIYFDIFDNKWIARGNSLSWRTNNPGLLHSRDIGLVRRNYIIGNHNKIAIFSSAYEGVKALQQWLRAQRKRLLLKIAQRLQPDSSEECMDRLCRLTSLTPEADGSQLSVEEIDRLIGGIKMLTDFSVYARQAFSLTPKIVAQFLSKDHSLEFYISSREDCLRKDEAAAWVLSHRLDAVVVHKTDGSIYLRSRPGHHRNQVRFSETDFSQPFDYENVLRDTGVYQQGQCIWGYINGIWNGDARAKKNLKMICEMTGDEQICSLINNFFPLGNGSVLEAIKQKLNCDTQIVRFAAQFFRLLINLSNNDPSEPPIVVFCHSQGAIIGNLALDLLSHKERQRLRLFTFGGGAFIPPGKSHCESHNYISIKDRIPQIAEVDALMALRLHQGRKAGYTVAQVLEQIVEEDVAVYLDLANSEDINAFSQQRRAMHEHIIQRVANVTVLDQTEAWFCEHSVDTLCYQDKIREVINHYKATSIKHEKAL